MNAGSMARAMSVIISMTLIAIWAPNWSMQVSVPFGPSAQRFGEHCKATTTAAASAHMVEMATRAYEETTTQRVGRTPRISRATADFDDPSDKKSNMFEA